MGLRGLFWYTGSPTRGFRAVSALVAVTIAGFSVFGLAGAATAATTAVHEITANWVGNPTTAPSGQAITSEWHISTNDANDPETDIVRGPPSQEQLQRATVKRQLHSFEVRVLENSDQTVVIQNFDC